MDITKPKHRKLLKVFGPDAARFLQGVLTIDVEKSARETPQYGLILTPKGRFHFDMFYVEHQGIRYLDHDARFSDDLFTFLKRQKLRAQVTLEYLDAVLSLIKSQENNAFQEGKYLKFKDPRCSHMGSRVWDFNPELTQNFGDPFDEESYQVQRFLCRLPELGSELIPDKTIPMEFGLDQMGAISFDKGCYLGQELQSRTKHRGVVRKDLYLLESSKPLARESDVYVGEEIYGKVTSALAVPYKQNSSLKSNLQGAIYLSLAHLRKEAVTQAPLICQGIPVYISECALR